MLKVRFNNKPHAWKNKHDGLSSYITPTSDSNYLVWHLLFILLFFNCVDSENACETLLAVGLMWPPSNHYQDNRFFYANSASSTTKSFTTFSIQHPHFDLYHRLFNIIASFHWSIALLDIISRSCILISYLDLLTQSQNSILLLDLISQYHHSISWLNLLTWSRGLILSLNIVSQSHCSIS